MCSLLEFPIVNITKRFNASFFQCFFSPLRLHGSFFFISSILFTIPHDECFPFSSNNSLHYAAPLISSSAKIRTSKPQYCIVNLFLSQISIIIYSLRPLFRKCFAFISLIIIFNFLPPFLFNYSHAQILPIML